MKNLADVKNCDDYIKEELQIAGIDVIQNDYRTSNEVPFSINGRLGNFIFTRAWYYWVVYGEVPLEQAIEMYENPIGATDIRVSGHCGCPSPRKGNYVNTRYNDDSTKTKYISNYHIDSQEGLNLFVKTIKDNNLLKPYIKKKITIAPQIDGNVLQTFNIADFDLSENLTLESIGNLVARIYRTEIKNSQKNTFSFLVNSTMEIKSYWRKDPSEQWFSVVPGVMVNTGKK